MSDNGKNGLQLILFKGVIFATVFFFAVVFHYFDNEQENSDDKTDIVSDTPLYGVILSGMGCS